MNKNLLKRFVERAMGDEEFRQALSTDSTSVLMQWGFTLEEAASLENLIERGTPFEELDERMSKYLFGGGGPG